MGYLKQPIKQYKSEGPSFLRQSAAACRTACAKTPGRLFPLWFLIYWMRSNDVIFVATPSETTWEVKDFALLVYKYLRKDFYELWNTRLDSKACSGRTATAAEPPNKLARSFSAARRGARGRCVVVRTWDRGSGRQKKAAAAAGPVS